MLKNRKSLYVMCCSWVSEQEQNIGGYDSDNGAYVLFCFYYYYFFIIIIKKALFLNCGYYVLLSHFHSVEPLLWETQ